MEESISSAIAEFEKPTAPTTIEFKVNGDFVEKLPQILSNISEIRKWAIAATETDRSLVLQTDEDFDKARTRSADIMKIIDSIETGRKSVKKDYLAPYEQFESAVKDVTAVLKSARENLWGQIQTAEEAKKREKGLLLKAYYEEKAQEAGVLGFRTYEQISRTKWLNRTTRFTAAQAEIDDIVNTIAKEVETIKALRSDFENMLLDEYAKGASVLNVISYDARLKQSYAEAQSRKAQAEKAAAEAKETPPAPQAQTAAEEETAKADEAEPMAIVVVDFRVSCTPEQLKGLSVYMRQNGIKYSKVPKGE